MATIDQFRSQLSGGGARANHFQATINFPSGVPNLDGINVTKELNFLCKAAELPGSEVDPVPVQYRGRTINFAGERRFSPFTVQVYNDTDFKSRKAFEAWTYYMQQTDSSNGTTNPFSYSATLSVAQLNRNDNILAYYNFINAFPIQISPIGLDYDAANQIEIYSVTFIYDYWVPDNSKIGSKVNGQNEKDIGETFIQSGMDGVKSKVDYSINAAFTKAGNTVKSALGLKV